MFNPMTAWCGEEPGFPQFGTSPAGGSTVHRCLHVHQHDVFDWILYFTASNPIDPYTLNATIWKVSQRPFEKQERLGANIGYYGPGAAEYEFALLDLEYESVGMRYYPGFGVVKEELKPRQEQDMVGLPRSTSQKDMEWATEDADHSKEVLYGERPKMQWGGSELIVTFPFAPTGREPFPSGSVNSAAWTSFCLNNTFAPGTLKYIGPAMEASVVIPYIGIQTGLVRYRKSFLFHFREVDWNRYWRARTQSWEYMTDMSGNPYIQYPQINYASTNWFA